MVFRYTAQTFIHNPILRNIFFAQAQQAMNMNDVEFLAWLQSPEGFFSLSRSRDLQEPVF